MCERVRLDREVGPGEEREVEDGEEPSFAAHDEEDGHDDDLAEHEEEDSDDADEE